MHAGAASLSEALKQSICQVTRLHLGYNQTTDAGAASLSEALIKTFNLSPYRTKFERK